MTRALGGLAVLLVSAAAAAPAAEPQLADLADLSLEQLSNIEIISVSRQPERLSDAPASIFVITGEDIRRSGATSLPEALRLAPNLQVARSNSNTYAISARGFNNPFSNKLLVLIDGRTVYSPLFSGVFWDQQDVMLEDVERIEVISGPGATLWGANAVNGVINVITRSAKDTQGGLVALGGGNREGDAAFRYGGKLGNDGAVRAYGTMSTLGHTQQENGVAVADAADMAQMGFRADWGGAVQRVMLQGNAYAQSTQANAFGTPDSSGVNMLGRWDRKFANGSDLTVQAYYDHTERDVPGSYRDRMDILDVQAQHAIRLGQAHRVVWGGGYRYAHDSVENGLIVAFLPESRDLNWANIFVQDDIRLTRSLTLTAGIKLESNDYTGVDVLPTLRLAWKPADDQLVWGAISRAARAPSRVDREYYLPGNPPYLLGGGPDVQSELADVAELGYRGQITRTLSFSITAFHAWYDRLRSFEPSATPGALFQLSNKIEGQTDGIEAWAAWQVMRTWRLMAGVSTFDEELHLKPGSQDPIGPSGLGNDPHAQWMVRSLLNITDKHELDIMVRHVDSLPMPRVQAYTAVDVRFGWRPNRALELSLTLQNLFDPYHVEYAPPPPGAPSELGRSVFLKGILRFD